MGSTLGGNRDRPKVRSVGVTTVTGTPRPWFVRRAVGIALSAALVLALGVRLYGLGQEDFWLDEILSLTSSAGRFGELRALPHGVILEGLPGWSDLTPQSTWGGVWRGMAADSHPPLYFLLLSSWRRLFGDAEFTLRLLSVILSVASILPIALILREYEKRWAGVQVAAVLAVAFSYVHASEQCRPYAMAMFFVSVSFLALVKLETRWKARARGWRVTWVAVYAASVYLALLTHYLSLFVLVGQAVFAVARFRGRLRWIWGGATLAALSLFAVTWGASLWGQLDFMADQSWRMEQRPDHTTRTLLRMADLSVRLLFAHAEFKISIVRALLGVTALAGVLVLLMGRRCRAALVFAVWYLVPVAILGLLDLVQQKQTLAMMRYATLAVPGLAGMLVLALGCLRPRLRHISMVGLAVIVAVTLPLPPSVNPQNRRAASLIAGRLQPDTLLVFDATDWQPFWVSQIYNNVAYYLRLRLPPPLPPVVLLRESPDESLVSAMATYDRVIVVSPRVDTIPNPLPGRLHPVDRTSYLHQIGFIYLFERTPVADSP